MQTSIHPTTIPILWQPLQFRSLRPLRTPLRLPNNIMHMLLPKPLILRPPRARHNLTLLILSQLMLPILINPLQPVRVLELQHLLGVDAVPGRVVHVDVEVRTAHGDDHVDVYLQVVADTFFDEEGVVFVAAPPAGELTEGEEGCD